MHKFSKKDQIQLVNCFVGIHDIKCNCEKPAVHCAEVILKQLNTELTPQEKEHLKSCLGTTTDPTATTEENGGVTGEDLEALFADAGGDDDG